MDRIIVKTKDELIEIIKGYPVDADLNHLDVSLITDMSGLFRSSKFNGDISQWDVSKIVNMIGMSNHTQLKVELPDIKLGRTILGEWNK